MLAAHCGVSLVKQGLKLEPQGAGTATTAGVMAAAGPDPP